MRFTNSREGKRSTQAIGAEGEALARIFFEDMGFEILQTNWRHRHQEIDIIATDGRVLHIIEVKTQTSEHGGLPEESVNRKKLLNLMKAAEAYMQTDNRWSLLQFDILAVLWKNGVAELLWIEDIYL
jgi:putative endonuclease